MSRSKLSLPAKGSKSPASSSSTSSRISARQKVSRLLLPHLRKLSKQYKSVWDQLDPYQKSCVREIVDKKTFALYAEQGTGKTWVAGGVIEEIIAESFIFEGLVVVPLNNLESTWVEFLEKQFPNVGICLDWEEFTSFNYFSEPKILLLNYEKVPPLIKKLAKRRWNLIVYDEGHRLKDRSSLSSRTAAKLRRSSENKLILTGTPLDKNLKDLWAQFRFIKSDIFGEHWKDFEREFLEPVDFSVLRKYRKGSLRFQLMLRQLIIQKGKAPFRQDQLPEFLRRIAPYSMRLTKKQTLNLLDPVIHKVPVTLRGAQRRVYDELERHSISGSIVAPLKMTQIWKLHQVCGGYVIDRNDEVVTVGDAKLARLLRRVHASKPPLVIFAYYLEEVWAIYEELRSFYKVAVICGKTKKQRPKNIKDFQAGKLDILICQNRSGGVGIDLFKSHTGLIYSCRHSWIDFDQMIARLHRRGQENEVNIFLIYAIDTVDEDIVDTLLEKGSFVERVLNRLKRK